MNRLAVTMQLGDRQAALRGVAFVVIGVAALLLGRHYPDGSTTEMGPGYFPDLAAGLLIFLGCINWIAALRQHEAAQLNETQTIRPLILVIGGVLAFSLLVERTSLLLAILAVVTCAALGGQRLTILQGVLIFLVLSVMASCLFVFGFGQPASYLIWR